MNARRAAYWITTVLVALIMLTGGIAYLMRAEVVLLGVTELGYPASFIPVLGVWKVLGAIALLAPRLPRVKEWAYAGIVFNLSCGAYAHIAVGHPPDKFLLPLAFVGLAVTSWALRPASRMLPAPPAEPPSERAGAAATARAAA